MQPYKSIALGLLVVSVDLTLNGFDLIVDALGWFLVVVALDRLVRQAHPAFLPARAAAVVAAGISLMELFPISLPPLVLLLLGLTDAVVLVLIAVAVMKVAGEHGDAATASRFNVQRWVVIAAEAAGWVAMAGVASVLLVVLVLLARLWYIVELFRAPAPALRV